ncbi:Hypothetical protein LUCI_2318 [Lucifera butyrica]|uniref:Uncharacterized protein n=1 Tax=Lucifera butyrica TaxID=1351585 RepID=A0A498R6G1_9FIRM|nr:hypothetical protein [Lucifera butyrica]VBB07074.1 Hypothetical protein LUCI_2318 [Lucifera butyrica]
MFFNLTPMAVVILGAIIGIAFALPLTVDKENVFANVLDLAAEMIFIIAAQRVLLKNTETAAQTAAQNQAAANHLQRQIDELTEKIAKRRVRLIEIRKT